MGKAIMLQGTGSNVGKSLLVAGLCRAAARRGLVVRPFKPQNMSNNAAVTPEGGEIGRAQATQALACGVPPHTDMNPVLLKPETETGAQVIVQGQRLTRAEAADYAGLKPRLMGAVLESFAQLKSTSDLVIVEGAGSPAETNLRPRDIANMGFATAADVPVVLAGDIDRGGVIAQLVGTHAVLDDRDRAMIVATVINRFRGDVRLFDDGVRDIVARTGWPCLGVVPWFADAWKLPAEDAVEVTGAGTGPCKIAVPVLSRIANFDDLDPLKLEPGVEVVMIPPGQPLPGDADLVILAGTKSTIGELGFVRAQGWHIDLAAHIRRGGHVLGICGGYQMLGQRVADPGGVDGAIAQVAGLGALDVETVMAPQKRLGLTAARDVLTGTDVTGYEIHMGETDGPDRARPFLSLDGRGEGAVSATGRVMGTYLHGVFGSDAFRAAFLARIGATGGASYGPVIDQTLIELAEHLEAHLDVEGLLALAR
ncbi:adenosylcobyric acid synthase [Rubricella aquisinus]|uniref:Cobyric acid synthase n=1 Tax=Rubricella aquisinus TaxID=2028108 RepID=A0A840WZ85_9RHOB|nr:cobyric acid synthase [Rubricella aquisinus]MBB5514985.1 adenosylcobyric acid synthase [Rubricella aquisinus]